MVQSLMGINTSYMLYIDVYQLILGLFDEAKIHLTGLKSMVNLRGGITDDSIRCSPMLPQILVYACRPAIKTN